MNDIEELVNLSRYAGMRFDLIQAGGGNTSVKLDDGTMLIKASGVLLADVTMKSGYSIVKTKEVADVISNEELSATTDKKKKEELSAKLVNDSTLTPTIRPSIETLLHSVLHKFVLHTHPILVNIITARKNWKEQLDKLFPEAVKIDYYTPGIELAVALQAAAHEYQQQHGKLPSIIFLQNHGLIIASDDPAEIITLNEAVLTRIESFLGQAPLEYKLTTSIAALFEKAIPGNNLIMLLSNDSVLTTASKQLLFEKPFTPDILVFCGAAPLVLDNLTDPSPIVQYVKDVGSLPKIIMYENKIFMAAVSIKKAKETEEVLKFHIITLQHNEAGNVNFLPQAELDYLLNWEAEKYRQTL